MLLFALGSGAVHAEESAVPSEKQSAAAPRPIVREIAFEGNDVTRPKVMLREMVIAVGDPADPEKVERSRQAVLDLGLFKRVNVRQEPIENGVRLVYTVEERFYLVPIPRLDINSDGQYAFGAQVRWNNVAGLNHSANTYYEQRDRAQTEFGRETNMALSYYAPFVLGTRYGVGASVFHSDRPTDGPLGQYEERFVGAGVWFTRSLSSGPASQGWTIGGGLNWLDQSTAGVFAEPAYGAATSVHGNASHRDLRYKVYSETGTVFNAAAETAVEGLASDYDYLRYTVTWRHYMPLGKTPHQTWHVIASAGAYHGGPDGVEPFEMGGASELRGYKNDFVEGDAFYHLALEAARPLFWRWLRGVVILEAGNAFPDPADVNFDKVYSSLGLGLRVRLSHFVDVEIGAGWAWPLTGGERSGRFFASRVQ